jgi:hypothetical protein
MVGASLKHGRLHECILGFGGGNLKEGEYLEGVCIVGDNIKMDIKELEWEGVGLIDLSHNRDNGLGHNSDYLD